jgi:hypothetical protein
MGAEFVIELRNLRRTHGSKAFALIDFVRRL